MRSLFPILVLAVACHSEDALKTFNTNPEATITSHQNGDTVLEGYVTTFRGVVSDANHQSNELEVTWFSGDDIICQKTTPQTDGSTSCEYTINPTDETIILQVSDIQNASGTAILSLEVGPTEAPKLEIWFHSI